MWIDAECSKQRGFCSLILMSKVLLGCKSKSFTTFCLSVSILCFESNQFEFADAHATVDEHTLNWHSVCCCRHAHGIVGTCNDSNACFVVKNLYWWNRAKIKY